MKLIAGLGNPGKEYEKTRHNSGFLAVDKLAEKLGTSITSEKWNALIASVRINGEQVTLMKPLTYMNESGSAISQAVKFYKLQPEDILILHDDMDIPVGALRIRKNGSGGGQKGMKSIINALGTDQTHCLHDCLEELLRGIGEEQVCLVKEEDQLRLIGVAHFRQSFEELSQEPHEEGREQSALAAQVG